MEAMIGEIRRLAGQRALEGWALCDGQTLDIRKNVSLHAILGGRYGGDGIHTSALPNPRLQMIGINVIYIIAVEGQFPPFL